MPILKKSERLSKELTLFHGFAVSTAAMFSSGFFLLPGLAAAKTGSSVVLALIGVAIAWYLIYARHRLHRAGALFHVFARLGKQRFEGLDPELRSIMKEKGLRAQDPFDEVVARAFVIDGPANATSSDSGQPSLPRGHGWR